MKGTKPKNEKVKQTEEKDTNLKEINTRVDHAKYTLTPLDKLNQINKDITASWEYKIC